jgi:DNA processing protein
VLGLGARKATIAVRGCGTDVAYSKENQEIFEQVEQRRAIVGEFPIGTFPAPQIFPIRNRNVAGKACTVVVVENAQYSGSLITACMATEFGRGVFGAPAA